MSLPGWTHTPLCCHLPSCAAFGHAGLLQLQTHIWGAAGGGQTSPPLDPAAQAEERRANLPAGEAVCGTGEVAALSLEPGQQETNGTGDEWH